MDHAARLRVGAGTQGQAPIARRLQVGEPIGGQPMLTADERAQLRADVLDLIDIRAARLLGVPRWCLRGLRPSASGSGGLTALRDG
jgi:hypothetical protein